MKKRRRFKQNISLQGRLTAYAKEVREHAESLPPGTQRDELMKKARQAEAASHMDEWVTAPGLQSPK
jgi:hypothetical protein